MRNMLNKTNDENEIFKSIMSKFPMKDKRPEQVDIIKQVSKAISERKKYIIIEAPTGCGKSPVAIAICRHFKNAFICTDQKILQQQYLKDFNNFAVDVKGRSNFNCKQYTKDHIPCNEGKCTNEKDFACPGSVISAESQNSGKYAAISARRGELHWTNKATNKNKCGYWKQKTTAMESEIVINNYAYLLNECNHAGDFGSREVLISDEGHNIEKHIMNYIKLEISKSMGYELGLEFPIISLKNNEMPQNNYPQKELGKLWESWLEKASKNIPQLNDILEKKIIEHNYKIKVLEKKAVETKKCIVKTLDKIKLNNLENEIYSINEEIKYLKEDINKIDTKVKYFHTLREKILRTLKMYTKNRKNWIIDIEQKSNIIMSATFKPVKINEYTQDTYFKFGDTNIIMSATILDFKIFTNNLGIHDNEYTGIKIKAVFPAESNKLRHLNVCDLSFKNTNTDTSYANIMSTIVEKIDEILEKHTDDKGIIHCNTYKNMDFIKHNSTHSNRILTHTPENRLEVIEHHMESKSGTILCSPSMSEGLDLKDNQSRFQIIVKIPYPNYGDLQIKERIHQDPKFKNYKTSIYLVQAIGRSVRNKKDHASTYTLDSRFPSFCRRNKKLLENFNRHEVKRYRLKL